LSSMIKEALLKQVESNIRVCKKLPAVEKATNPVPGEGNIDAK